jgi:hypothetical protein
LKFNRHHNQVSGGLKNAMVNRANTSSGDGFFTARNKPKEMGNLMKATSDVLGRLRSRHGLNNFSSTQSQKRFQNATSMGFYQH